MINNKLTIGKTYRVTGWARNSGGGVACVRMDRVVLWQGNGAIEEPQCIDSTFVAIDDHITFGIEDYETVLLVEYPCKIKGNSHTLSINDIDPTIVIDGKEHKPVFTSHNVGNEWPRKCKRKDNHEGQEYSEYLGKWVWL